jgi:hypothetical protein
VATQDTLFEEVCSVLRSQALEMVEEVDDARVEYNHAAAADVVKAEMEIERAKVTCS